MKKMISSFLVVIMLMTTMITAMPVVSNASAETDRIISQIRSTFTAAKSLAGVSSFDGYCPKYVKYQLIALGITTTSDSDIRGNGNQMYNNIQAGTTSKGYTKTKYSGNNSLRNIISANGSAVYNIVVSWTYQYGYSTSNPGYGHATFIHAIIDNVVYYSESYSTSSAAEGAPQSCSLDTFYSKYNKSYGNAIGAVHFTNVHTCNLSGGFKWFLKSHPHHNCYACSICGAVNADTSSSNYYSTCETCNTTINEGNYLIKNDYFGQYLVVADDTDADGQNIYLDDIDNGLETIVYISSTSYGYKLRPLCSTARVVSPNTTSYTSVTNICLHTDEATSAQSWKFQPHNGGYIIRNMQDSSYVLDCSGDGNIVIAKYHGGQSQTWYLEDHIHEYVSEETLLPTCTEDGIMTYTCTCGNTYTEMTSALGHTLGDPVETQAPSCTAEGINTTYCSVCGEYLSKEAIPMIDHNWSEWKVFTEETDTEPALLIRYCKSCNISETKKDIIAEGVCGENATWVLKNNGELYITGSGEMTDYYFAVSMESAPWQLFSSDIESVVICSGITQIGIEAFRDLPNLKDVTLPNTVTSIRYAAFSNCDSLKFIELPDSILTIEGSVFRMCDALEKIVLSDSVKEIGYECFLGCENLESITIPKSVTKIDDNAFYGCVSLESIYVEEENDNYSSIEGVLYDKNVKELLVYPGGKKDNSFSILTSVEKLEPYAFYRNSYLMNIDIPNSVKFIGDSCFSYCTSLENIIIPDSVENMRPQQFVHCTSLKSVVLGNSITDIGFMDYCGCSSLQVLTVPESVVGISSYAFQDANENVIIKCFAGSFAHNFAVEYGKAYELIHNCSFVNYIDNEATCTENGTKTAKCEYCDLTDTVIIEGSALGHDWSEWVTVNATCTEDGSNSRTCNRCGEMESEVIPAIDHNWSEWIQISAPTATQDGEQLRYCKNCKTPETEIIPALGEPEPDPEPEEPVAPNAPAVVSVNNYTITLDKITDIKEIRFAIGHYSTGSEIKAAEKNVTLDASTVKKYTDNGIFTYDLPWMGEYTFWVRLNDGSQYFVYTDVDEVTPYVESYGVKLTVKDYAENYKDMWLAEGTFNSYSEIKASTAFKYQASANKLDLYAKTTHDFSYTMTNPGPYTVLIRYNDGSFDVIHHELTVDYPEFSGNGLQITVQNIPDIKIIRTAYGHYTSVGDIKKASGVRNFSNKNDIKNAEDYMIQYREAGEVTLIVEYNNGYKHFYYHNIQPKSATMIQSENTVMFDDLDGFVMIRYAKGKYTTSSQIKAAEGSKVVKPADLIGGYAIISDLEAGTYTFCVQFDDESYDYYTVIVE